MVGNGPAGQEKGRKMENALDIGNWIIAGQATLKVLSFFWPVAVVGATAAIWIALEERRGTRAR